MLIKALLLSAVFCTVSCSEQLTDILAQAEPSTPAVGAQEQSETIFVKGDGTDKPASVDAPLADLPVADWIIVDKSDRNLVLFKEGKEIKRYTNIRFGDEPKGHKQFEGDEKTPEGVYEIDGRNPGSAYHLSLRVSYPNEADRAFAARRGRSPGGDIFIHGQPNGHKGSPIGHDWTDGCVAVSNEEIREIWQMVPDGAKILIQP